MSGPDIGPDTVSVHLFSLSSSGELKQGMKNIKMTYFKWLVMEHTIIIYS